MIYFVGAGSGAIDLITVKGKDLLERADLIIYAGSLVNPGLLEYAKNECVIMDSASMTLEEVIDAMVPATEAGKLVVRLHTGIRVFMALTENRWIYCGKKAWILKLFRESALFVLRQLL